MEWGKESSARVKTVSESKALTTWVLTISQAPKDLFETDMIHGAAGGKCRKRKKQKKKERKKKRQKKRERESHCVWY
jgi:hypothetical protein